MSIYESAQDGSTVEAARCCPTLMQAAKSSHPRCTTWILSHGSGAQELLRRQNLRLPKPLHEAAGAKPRPGKEEVDATARVKPACTMCVEALLAAGADPGCPDEGGRSPLQRAAMMGCVPCIEALLRSPQTEVDATCDGNATALLEAIRINSVRTVRALLGPPRSASARALSDGQIDPLIEALRRRAYDCVASLVEAGAPVNPVQGIYQCSFPLTMAIDGCEFEDGEKGNDTSAPEVLKLLVKLGADVNAQGPSERSALSHSASRGLCESMRVLLELGADPMSLSVNDESPLHMAASSCEPRACQLLVDHITEASGSAAATAALLAKDRQGKNPFHFAMADCWRSNAMPDEVASCLSTLLRLLSEVGGVQVVERVLREALGEERHTLAHLAAHEELPGCQEVLTQTAEGTRIALEAVDKDGLTPVALARENGLKFETMPAFAQMTFPPCCSSISEGIKNGHTACLRGLLRDRGTPKGVEVPGRDASAEASAGRTPSPSASEPPPREEGDPLASVIHDHCSNSCPQIVRLLLKAGFCPDGCRADGAPLRHSTDLAGWGDNLCIACTRQLIDAGARGFFAFEGDDFRKCVMYSVLQIDLEEDGHGVELVETMLSACDIAHDTFGVTDLCRWAGRIHNYFGIERGLVEAGVDVLAKDEEGRTSLHLMAGMLNYCGYTYHCANGWQDDEPDCFVEVVEWLMSKGAITCLNAQDDDGDTPLHVAVRKGFGRVAEKLLEAGADPCLQNTDGDTALHVAADDSVLHMATEGSRAVMVARLIDAGAGVNTKNNRGFTALLMAAKRPDLDTATVLVDGEASCSIANNDGTTPLLVAAAHGHVAICSLLVARGGDMRHADNLGNTALSATLESTLEAAGGPRYRARREAVTKLLIGLGCPVGEIEVHAASRGPLTQAFADAIAARMNAGTSAQDLGRETTLLSILPPAPETDSRGAPSPSHKRAVDERALDEEGAERPSLVAVRLRSRQNLNRPTACSAQRVSGARASTSPVARGVPSKVYHLDSAWLRRAVSHLEGSREAESCVLLRLLLQSSPGGGWAASYGRTGKAVAEQSPDRFVTAADGPRATSPPVQVASASVHPGVVPTLAPRAEENVGVSAHPWTPKPLVTHAVDLLSDGDDFDRAGFEAVLEYLSTGQVIGATCGDIHEEGEPSGSGSHTSVGVGTRAAATHRAAAFFGLPRLQGMVRDWLAANGAEMEDDDGTAVLSTTKTSGASSCSGAGAKRKFSMMH